MLKGNTAVVNSDKYKEIKINLDDGLHFQKTLNMFI